MTEPVERTPRPDTTGAIDTTGATGAPGASSAPAPDPAPVSAARPAPASPGPDLARPGADVADGETSTLPGEHRGGFRRELTEPVPIAETTPAAVAWEPQTGVAPVVADVLPRSAAWALFFAVLGMIVSFLVGWGFPLGLVGVVLAIVALRRPWESRQTAVWALCLSLVSLLYSAGWLWWASTQGPLFG